MLSTDEVIKLRGQIIKILDYLGANKARMRTEDYRQLSNHLQYAMTTLTNMNNMILVEGRNPYSALPSSKTLLYNPDGTTRIADIATVHTTGDGWESQFDQTLLLKPPCYLRPPESRG